MMQRGGQQFIGGQPQSLRAILGQRRWAVRDCGQYPNQSLNCCITTCSRVHISIN